MQKEQIEGFRLSPQQKYLWLLQQNDQVLPYRVACAVLIAGSLNVEMLKAALHTVVSRHEILRTTFHCLPGMTIPLQAIADCFQLSIDEENLSRLSPQEQKIKIDLLFDNLKYLSFDLENSLPAYFSIVTLSSEKHILFISLPALIADGVTLKYLVNEISNSYAANLQHQKLPDVPMQYADIAEWQNELLETEAAEIGKAYWERQNLFTILDPQLWLEKKHAQLLAFQPQFFSLNLPTDLAKSIELLAQKYHVTIPDCLLACWLVLLWKLTRQPDIVVSICSDGRKYEELESALGLLSKHLPLHCNLAGDSTFSSVLKRVHELANNADEWQEYFTWKETKELGARHPSICFEFEEWQETVCQAGISFSIYERHSCVERFKLKLTCVEKKDTLIAEFHFDSNLYKLEDVKTLAIQFQTVSVSAIDSSEAPISQLNILSSCDRQQILVEFNHTTVDYPRIQCIHQLFEAQVKRTPNNIAVVFEEQQLTYAQLNAKANQLAHHLQQLGVAPEVLVALYVERSLEAIVGMLGILKAGSAYLPLDPVLPKAGLDCRLQDAQPSVILTQQSLVERLPQHTAQVVCLDKDWEAIDTTSQENPSSKVIAENLAYVLFTSGSTGKPKGVTVEHQQLLNYLNAICDRLDLTTCNSFAIVSTFAADLGHTAIFPALCRGGCLHIVSPERAANPEALAAYFHRHPIDCLKIVPSHLAALLTATQPIQVLPKKRLILGGEPCRWQLIDQIQNHVPECLIFNHYGPTEATVGVLTYPVKPRQKCEPTQTVPIGRPIPNTQIYLLDSELQPVPIGVSGELYIGGVGVARGYLNRPELTSERFIPHPFGQTGRLYKTGDLARYLPDGNIEFSGRSDHQVKIHGFRIELGEIESALRQHPAVRETIVLGREEQPGKRLVAYVVTNKQTDLTTSELRGFLLNLLPEFMVPSVFVWLQVLPLTPNGKIDFQALPVPDLSRLELAETLVAPRTPTEQLLAEIWAEILELPQVGIHDNFFELGGDSIQSIRIVAKANQAGLQLTPKQMFEYQTIAELATVTVIAPTDQAMPANPAIANQHQPSQTYSYTSTDFPSANVSQKDLEQILAKINRKQN